MYESLAAYYDKFMMDVPYAEWVSYVESFLGGSAKLGRDVGCGTGKFTVALKRDGYDVTGSDSSPEMLRAAEEYARTSGVNVRFLLQSAEKLEDHAELDFVIACCDVVNYLKNPTPFFQSAYRILKKGGVLAFDISSEYKLKEIIGNNLFTDESDDGIIYLWENSLRRGAVDMKLTFFAPNANNLYLKHVETQTQYIHDVLGIKQKLKEAGFSSVSDYGFLTKTRPKAKEERIQFIAYKQE